MARGKRAGRDPAIDIIRGLCIASMVVAHTAINSPLYVLTHSPLWVDAATGFVALAGLVIGMVQARAATDRVGLTKLGRRTWLVYLAHLALVGLALLVAPWNDLPANSPPPAAELGGWPSAVWQAVTLRINPENVDILSMYVLLFGAAAVAVSLLRRGRVVLVGVLSAVVYVLGLIYPAWFTLPEYPGEESFFNVATWQGLFVVGLVLGWYWRARGLDEVFGRRRTAVWAGGAALIMFVLAQPIERLRVLDFSPALDELVRGAFAKGSIGPGRILLAWCAFAALYYMLQGERLRAGKRLATVAFHRVGQRSLDSFVILSVFVILLPVVAPYDQPTLVGIAWSLVVFAACWLWAQGRAAWDARKLVGERTGAIPSDPRPSR